MKIIYTVAVCRDTDKTCWEESFFAYLHRGQDNVEASDDEEEGDSKETQLYMMHHQ